MRQLVCLFVFLIVITQSAPPPPDWIPRIQQAQMLFTEKEPTSEIMASVGNGYVATVVGSQIIYLSGVFNGLNTEGPSHRAAIPATNAFTVVSGIPTGSALDLERAIYYRRGTIGNAMFEQRWYAHMTQRSILAHEILVSNAQGSSDLVFSLSLNSMETKDFNVTKQPNGANYSHYTANIVTPEEPNGYVTSIAVISSLVPSQLIVPAKQSKTFYFITAIRTNLDSSNPSADAITDFNNAFASISASQFYNEHVKAWESVWESRVEIAGDLRLAQVVNASLYYILSSVRSDWDYSLSPGSLSSNGYNGHSFWDCEIWMYPSVLLTHPELARGLIQYRVNRIDGAAEKAKSYNKGYQGYMFPWESAFTGQEVCPSSAPTGELEQHITGDIAFAMAQYWQLTQDKTWLTNVYPVIEGIAEFWVSRVEYNSVTRQYEINGVIPPDEYAVNVNNSVYTNVVAGISLNFAHYVAGLLGKTAPSTWTEIASNLKIPIDNQLGIHLEYDNYPGNTIKQADVILLGYPLGYPMTEQMRLNDLVYYQERTDKNGPAMTFAMENIAWLELGQPDQAQKVWPEAWANAKDPFMVWTETPTGGTVNFITGAGGFLQAVFFGYGGIRLKDNQMTFNPQLPQPATSFKFRKVNYRGNEIQVYFDSVSCSVTKTNSNDQGQKLELNYSSGKTVPLSQNNTISFPRGPFSLNPQ